MIKNIIKDILASGTIFLKLTVYDLSIGQGKERARCKNKNVNK